MESTLEVSKKNAYNCKLAYNVYVDVFNNWNIISKSEQDKARRQVESTVREAGFKGHRTGLISKNAWQVILDTKKSIQPKGRLALEHPITYTNVALYCIKRNTPMTFDEYFEFWGRILITTQVTNAENQYLKKFQESFRIGIDSWEKMYEDAGIELIIKPKLSSHEDKRKWGLM